MRSYLKAHALSLAALVAAVLLRLLLDPLMGESLPLVTLFGAVAAAVWLGGYRPAILVGIVGYLACDYLFIQPREAGFNTHMVKPVDHDALVELLASLPAGRNAD